MFRVPVDLQLHPPSIFDALNVKMSSLVKVDLAGLRAFSYKDCVTRCIGFCSAYNDTLLFR